MNQVATKTDFYFRPRYRKSPFFESTQRAGCKAYGIYNHMYIPDYYSDAHEEYQSLINDVTLWDVSVERIVEITGPDASECINRLTPRDLTKCAVGQGKYVLITAEDGGIINEPVLLRLGENQWWLALSDSDAGLWARGYAVGSGLDVKVREPEVYPVQVQGPKSKDVMAALFGDAVLGIRYYWTLETDLDGIPVVISRTGWTGELGFEVYTRADTDGPALWRHLLGAGAPFGLIHASLASMGIRRIEAGILDNGTDMDSRMTPFAAGIGKFVDFAKPAFIGKAAPRFFSATRRSAASPLRPGRPTSRAASAMCG